jgi:hypothetical protein
VSIQRAPETGSLYGLMAEFDSPQSLVRACEAVREAGYTKLDAYTPYPIEEVWEAIGHHRSRLPLIVLAGGLVGCVGGFALQYWASTIAYPLNVGGRPLASWVAFIVPAFETTILCASFAAVLGMFALNGLPMPYHPVFNVERFGAASRDSYFLMIGAVDPLFEPAETWRFLQTQNPTFISEVEG